MKNNLGDVSNLNKLIAIYTRKSKYTGKGESIDNQIELCKSFLMNRYNQDILKQVIIYEDEGFTGSNTNRPQFQKMLNELQKGNYSMLIVYRLDRISRNVLDFCALKDQLSNWGIDFISITENFDTSTPMGSAMLMITSVFAQLERDTIAERIRDNMQELAKTGRWLGGTTPLGYVSKKIEKIAIDGKKRSLYQLTFDEEEIEKVKLIFSKYKELKSLSKIEAYLIQRQITTRKGVYFSRFALSNILRNLAYCKADHDIKNFFEDKNIEVFTNNVEFDGKHGLITYNKRIQKKAKDGKTRKNEEKDITQWIVAIGKHQGIIDGKEWIDIWETLESKVYNKRGQKVNAKIESLLSGILKCDNCSSFMRPKILKTFNQNNERNFVYLCELKSKSRKNQCGIKNINGRELDKIIINQLKEIIIPDSNIINILKKLSKDNFKNENYDNKINTLNKILNDNKRKMRSLLDKLALVDKECVSIVTTEIKEMKKKKVEIEKEIGKIKNKMNNIQYIENIHFLTLNLITNFFDEYNFLDIYTKREIIRLLISSIKYNGRDIIITL